VLPVVVTGPFAETSPPSRSRVTATIDGHPVWFETSDVALQPSAEGLASAVLLPATRRGRALRINQPVSATWRVNVVRLMEIWSAWWGYPVIPPEADERPDSDPGTGTALCFTGGLDSFHCLLRGELRPDALVFVQGYDIPLADHVRMAAWDRAMGRIAADVGVRPIRLRSNLREHPLVARAHWDRAHGGALAALGHLLPPVAGTLLIASSAPTRYGHPFGSHERTDPLWSSDRLRVIHQGASESRVAKLRAIADEDLAGQHLRVCWENRSSAGNCSACDKCVSTMAMIVACADPGRFVTFEWSVPLHDRIARVRSTRFVRTYGELLEQPLPAPIRKAIAALLRRSVIPNRLRRLWHGWRG
jgi:hypothetical protein